MTNNKIKKGRKAVVSIALIIIVVLISLGTSIVINRCSGDSNTQTVQNGLSAYELAKA